MIPLLGWSQVGSPGGVLHDPETNDAFVRELNRRAGPQLMVRELPLAINDDEFGYLAAQQLLEFMGIDHHRRDTEAR
jgi:uncharacterized protein (UPF0261 family)